MGSFTAPPIIIGSLGGARHAELVFHGVEQAGPSFEARVFLNNPGADESTEQTPAAGYAGSFHVYGYGDPPPPAMAEAKARLVDGDGPIAPIEKRVEADEAAFRAAVGQSDDLIVTVVTISTDQAVPPPERPFEHVDVVFDRAATES